MSRHSEALAGLLNADPMPCIRAAAEAHQGAVLCVGGAVRDALLGRAPADVDIAVSGDLEAFVALFERSCGRRPVAVEDRWRDTRRTRVGDVQVDLGRMLGGAHEDLAQRDFTINAMAVELAGGDAGQPALIDPLGGADDLERRLVRMLSADALQDDPLRMLRAVRYRAALAGFAIEPATEEAIAALAPRIVDAAAERVQSEWAALLAADRWLEGARQAYALGLGEATLAPRPDWQRVAAWAAFEQQHGAPAEGRVTARLAALLAATPVVDEARLRAALEARRWPGRLAQRAARIAAWTISIDADADIAGWALDDALCAAAAARLARALGDSADDAAPCIERLAVVAERATEEPWVRGSDLRSWGVDEGPALGELLQEAARGQIERRWSSAGEARDWARRHAQGGSR